MVQFAQFALVRRGAALISSTACAHASSGCTGVAPSRGSRCWSPAALALLALVLWQFIVPCFVTFLSVSSDSFFGGRIENNVSTAVSFLEIIALGGVPNAAMACGCVLTCALIIRATDGVAECASDVGTSGGCSRDVEDDGAPDIRCRVSDTLHATFGIVRLAQRLAMCLFGQLISFVILMTTAIQSRDIPMIVSSVAFLDMLLPLLCFGACAPHKRVHTTHARTHARAFAQFTPSCMHTITRART